MFLPLSNPQAPTSNKMNNGNVMQKYINILAQQSKQQKREDMNQRFLALARIKGNKIKEYDKRMLPKLKDKIHTTVVLIRPALTYEF